MNVSKAAVAKLMVEFFATCQETREQGQKEYAHDESNALANFERSAEGSGVTREQAWSIFAGKHWDGIMAHVKGHHSQREPVEGRIKDLVVYLVLYLAMTKQEEADLQAKLGKNREIERSAMDAAPTKKKEIGDPNDR